MALEKYRYILNDVILDRIPDGWENIQISIERDMELNNQVVRFTSELIFLEDGYNLIKREFEVNYNNTIDVTVQSLRSTLDDYEDQFTGKILLSDVKFNLEKRFVTVNLEDSSFHAAIDTRKNLEVIIDSEFTINGEKISPVSSFQMDFFRITPGTFNIPDRLTYLVQDVLDFLVRFMTDNEVKGIVSNYLTDSSNFDNGFLFILTGAELRLKNQDPPDISFNDLFTNLRRTHDIGFDFEVNSSGETVMRIEDEEFFFNQTESTAVRDILDLELEVDKERLFSHIEIGNETFAKESFPFNIRFFVFRNEQYGIQGKSVVDRVLDLKNDYITDSNVYEDIISNNNDEFDDEILLVEGQTDGSQALRFGSSSPFNYNDGFINNNILARHINGIPSSIVKYLSAGTTPCKIGILTNQEPFPTQTLNANVFNSFVQTRFSFDNENSPFFDEGNNYFATPDVDGNAFYYNVPFASDFTFKFRLPITINNQVSPAILTSSFTILVKLQRLTPAFVVLNSIISAKVVHLGFDDILRTGTLTSTGTILPQNTVILEDTHKFTCDAGDRIAVELEVLIIPDSNTSVLPPTIQILASQLPEFNCFGSDTDGGVFEEFDPLSYRAQIYRFSKNVPLSQMGNILRNPKDKILINEGSDPAEDRSAWIRNVSYDLETSVANFELIT